MGLRHRNKQKNQEAYKQKREAHPSLASLSKAPENCLSMPKRATPNFTPIHVYHTLYTRYAYRVDTP